MVNYPYLPKGHKIQYTPDSNPYMKQAKEFAKQNSLDRVMPTAAIIVKDSKILGIAANGSKYHEEHGCERVRLNIPTGQHYELCEGCHPKNHGEVMALKDAVDNGFETKGGDLYLWGHWWCCEPCWNAMIESGIKDVYLLENSEVLFNKTDQNNIVGHQFDF